MWSANATSNFFILQNLTTCFGPYGPSSGDNYRNDIQYVLFSKILTLLQYIHCIYDCEAYLLLLNLYLYNIEEFLKYTTFYIRCI
jgi:hypothetical protein